MDFQHRIKYLMCAAALLFGFHTVTIAAPNLILGPELCLKTRANNKISQYILDLGIFKSQSGAISYQQQIRRFSQYPVNMTYQKHLDAYMVSVGPINSVSALHQVCRQVLSSQQAKTHKHTNPQPISHRQKPVVIPKKLIFGPEICLKTRPKKNTTQTMLALGVFNSQARALAYQQRIKHLTPYPVQVKYLNHLNAYRVVLGPINHWADLQHTCKKILAATQTVKHHPSLQKPKSVTPVYAHHNRPGNKSLKMGVVGSREQNAPHIYQYAPHPYVGINTGLLLNTSGVPATYAGWEGTIFAGFGVHLKHKFYVGAEILGSNSKFLRNVYPVLLPANAHSTGGYGVHAMPGYWINDLFLLYLPVGAVKTTFEQSQDGAPRHVRKGWQIGLGAQNKVARNIDVRLEYLFTDYSKRSGFHRLQELGRAHMYGDQFSFGALYRFTD